MIRIQDSSSPHFTEVVSGPDAYRLVKALVLNVDGTLIQREDVDSVRSVYRSTISVFFMRTIDNETGLNACPVDVPRIGPYGTVKYPFPRNFVLSSFLNATWVESVLRTQRALGEKMLPYIQKEKPIDLDTEGIGIS